MGNHAAVTAILAEMGLPSAPLVRTVLIHDNYFLGEKYYFEGGYALCLAEKPVIEVYNDDGKLLKAVGTAAKNSAA